MKQSWRLIVGFCFAHCLIFLVLFGMGIYGFYYRDDFMPSYIYSSHVLLNRLPYRDFAVEYPPLGVAFIVLPGLVSGLVPATYAQVFNIEILLFDLAGILIVSAMAQRLNLCLWKTLGVYTLALLGIGPIITVRYDLIPAIITLLSIYTFIRGNYKISWALLAAGTLTKLYPAVLAPVFLLYHLCHHDRRYAIKGLVVFAITGTIIMITPLILSPEGFLNSLSYHFQRGLQVESTYASLLFVGQLLGLTSLDVKYSFGSDNVVSPVADVLSKLSLPVMLISLIAVYWFFYRAQKDSHEVKEAHGALSMPDSAGIVKYSFLSILVFMLTSKVLSPQFIIWLYPLIPLALGHRRNILWLFIVLGLMTYFIYQYGVGLETGSPLVIAMLFLRNVALVVLAFLAAKSWAPEYQVGCH